MTCLCFASYLHFSEGHPPKAEPVTSHRRPVTCGQRGICSFCGNDTKLKGFYLRTETFYFRESGGSGTSRSFLTASVSTAADSLFAAEKRLCAPPEELVSIFSATAIQMSSLT